MLRVSDVILNLSRPLLKGYFSNGSLEVLSDGRTVVVLGDGRGPGFAIHVDRPRTFWKILSDPDLACGELYADGKWNMAEGDLGQMLSWFCRNNEELIHDLPPPQARVNDPQASRKNVAHHYDLGNDLYKSFLDEGMNYSCAFFEDHRMSLRDAQQNKLFTILKRLDIRPGMRVLDIGCGWGELTRLAARSTPDAYVTGITLAEEQIAYAREKASETGEGAPQYLFSDYRDHAKDFAGYYDRIVSVGMFEHVGRAHFDDYFGAISRMLKPGGRALVHSIMQPRAGDATARWLDAYIFPGGCIPYMPEALAIADQHGLKRVGQPFIHAGTNYAETLRRWRANFNANAHTLPARYDARFRRIWNYYLAMSEAAFDGLGYYVAQMVFEK